jgi:integrating conjugative element protein (TIGR03756 family)
MWHKIKKMAAILLLLSVLTNVMATTKSPGSISTFSIAWKSARHTVDYSHFSVIGSCVWLDKDALGVPSLSFTLELDEYLPDMIVTSFNEAGDDPWDAARISLDKASYATGNIASKSMTGYSLGNGQTSEDNDGGQKANSLITKYVDVIGNPDPLKYFPFLSLRLDTHSFFPYYSSAVDTTGRLGIAEALRLPQNMNLLGYIIGQGFTNKWGYEFPRSMTSNTTNDYEASVMSALRAADIVSNKNTLHIVKSTRDSCGANCAVANVIEEQHDKHEIWEEVYPHDRHIQLGQDARAILPGHYLGENDDKAGNGNYVFLVWRHYRGCIQHSGKFLWAMIKVPPTVKR